MTDDSIREQPDTMPESPASNNHNEQDRNDIVRRTSLPLLSLTGLGQPPPSGPLRNTTTPLADDLSRSTTVPLPETKREEVVSPPLDVPFVPASRAVRNTKTESGSGLYAGQLVGPQLPNRKVRSQRISQPSWLFFLLTLAFCLLLSGVGAYIYIYNWTTTHGTAQLPRPLPSDKHAHNNVVLAPRNGSSSGGNDFASRDGQSFQVGGQPTLVLKGQNGSVNVVAGNAGTIIVKASSKDQSADTINQNIRYDRSYDGQGHDVINLATEPGHGNINYDMVVPASAQIKIEVSSGSISVAGVSGVSVDTNSGSLDIEDVSGPVNVYTTNGDITARNLKGQVIMESVNGSVRANAIVGQMKAVTQNGDVVVREATLDGQSTLKTNYGSVRFSGTLDTQGTYTLSTHSGNVNLTLPGNAAFQFHASTGSGSIYNEFGGNIVGTAPRAQIVATIIGGGSIAVNKAV